jgi:hypothetical protein
MNFQKRPKYIELFFLLTNCGLAGSILLGKLLILSAGYDEDLYRTTGELVPIWPDQIKIFATIEIVVAIVMLFAAFYFWRGRRLARFMLLLSISFFGAVSFSEIARFVSEFGDKQIPLSMLLVLTAWMVWFVLNFALFRPQKQVHLASQ